MANPTLQRDSTERDWVTYLQQSLVAKLQADADAGQVQLSAVDGLFGPITEGSVIHVQRQSGLPETGIVDDATWNAILGTAPAAGASGGATGGRQVDLTVPLTLRMRWDSTTFEQASQDLLNLDLTTHPTAQLTYHNPVGSLLGNGGLQLLNREIRGWNWWLEWSTTGALDFSRTNGIELGVDNHTELGVRPLRGLELTIEGNARLMWAPGPATGSIEGSGMFWLKLNLDQLLSR